MKVNESALTGEAELVRKKELISAMLFSGTQVRYASLRSCTFTWLCSQPTELPWLLGG